MISISPWLVYSMLNIQNVIGVRIFQNVLPVPMPTKYIEYVPQVISKTCLLKPEVGPCRANIDMYYYDPEIGNCTSFKWGGCQGNGNRFDSSDQCRDKCLSKQESPIDCVPIMTRFKVAREEHRPRWCALTFDYGFCFGAIKRWYFDNLWKVCKSTIFSGCGGNRNNFYSLSQCESICLYGNGPVTLEGRDVTAPTKVLIINPRSGKPERSRAKDGDKGEGNGDGVVNAMANDKGSDGTKNGNTNDNVEGGNNVGQGGNGKNNGNINEPKNNMIGGNNNDLR